MAIRWLIDRGYTIAENETHNWTWNWFGDQGGPNKGPVIFRAVSKGRGEKGSNSARNVLVTYDFAKCRGGPNDDHAPEVFYEFKIRNESTVAVPFDLEMILFTDSPINHG